MTEKSDPFRERLLAAEQISPALREGYQRELDAILHERPTLGTRSAALSLVVICVLVVIAEVRAMLLYSGGMSFYLAASTMLIACAIVAAIVLRDLVRNKSPRRNAYRVSEMFFGASWLLVVVQLLKGLETPDQPASTFNVLFTMSFAGVCTTWALANRISAAELANREQTLRLECRLVDLKESQMAIGNGKSAMGNG